MNELNLSSEAILHKAIAKLESLHTDMSDVKTTMRQLTDVISKLALVEERQTNAAHTLNRTYQYIEKLDSKFELLEDRIDSLEKEQPLQKQITQWVTTAIFACATVAVVYVAKGAGLL